MNILILGGTMFLGRALVESALASGHQITLFNRGQTHPELFPQVEKLRGDRRAGDLAALQGRTWDVVIDTSGYEPGVVRASAQLLAPATRLYCFISTVSVYASFREIGIAEQAPVAQLPEGADPDARVTMETYGAQKALCEQAAETAMPGRVLTIRPGLIVGNYDPTDRFTYWPYRVALGGKVLAPGRPEKLIQFIDVYDLAEWTLRMIETQQTGIYNAAGPQQPLPLGTLLESCRECSGSGAQITWASEEFLLGHGVQPWMEMPLWLPESDASIAGMDQVSIQKALDAGLSFRPLSETVQSALTWAMSRPADHVWRAGITPEKERELLALLG